MKKTLTAIMAVLIISFAFPTVRAKAETLKIGFVTDWEYGSQKKYTHKYPVKARAYIGKTVDYYNTVYQPDVVVGGGDYILGIGKKKNIRRQLADINAIFKNLNSTKLYCIGNHDLRKLSKEEVQRALGIDYRHYAMDLKGFRIITLDTNSLAEKKKKYGATGRISAEELMWLEDRLDTDLPVVVFSHHSPIQTPDGGRLRSNIIAPEELKSVLEKHNNVVAVFSGHHAVNYQKEVNGINYVIINNLADVKALGSFATISLEKDEENKIEAHVEQFGRKPTSYDFSKNNN